MAKPYTLFNVVDTAKLCGLELKESTLDCEEAQAKCPFCGDYKYRMYLSAQPDNPTFWCHNCGTGGNAVNLYAAFNPQGRNYTTYEAYLALLNEPSVRRDTVSAGKSTGHTETIRPLHERSRIYLELLSVLELEEKHRQNLRSRGLSDEIIEGNMYRSIPTDWKKRKAAVAYLSQKYDLTAMPGFFTKNGSWDMASCRDSGILIPVCTKDDRIQGLQIRLDDPPPKIVYDSLGNKTVKKGDRFRWLSSRGKYYENGTGIPSYIHVVGDLRSDTLHITEGPMKADIASYLSGGELFIGLTGVQNTRFLEEVVQGLHPKRILECVDMDVRTNPHVQRAQAKIRSICMPLCGDYRTFTWPASQKGIDDWLLFQKLKSEHGLVVPTP